MRTFRQIFRTLFLIALIGGVGAFDAFGQGKLEISGTVVNMGVGCAYERPFAVVNLFMQVYNSSDEPVIFFQPDFHFRTRVLFSEGASSGLTQKEITGDVVTFNPYLDDPFSVATEDDYDPQPEFIKSMSSLAKSNDSTPGNGWLIIGPGRSHEFRTILMVKNGFHFENILAKKDQKCTTGSFRIEPEHDAFRVEYSWSLKKYEGGEDLFFTLRDKWKPHGVLVLNSDGSLIYRSNQILTPDPIPDQ